MEIDGKNSSVGLNPEVQRLEAGKQPTQSSNRKDGASTVPQSDRVELSARGRDIQGLSEMIHSTPDTRDLMIEQIQIAIQNGTYNVKAEKIADKILIGNLVDKIF